MDTETRTDISVAFYKAKRGTWLDRTISLWTYSPYSHCELVIDGHGCFSCSARDRGVRRKTIDVIDTTIWDVIKVGSVTQEELDQMILVMEKYNGRPYDCLGQFVPGLSYGPSFTSAEIVAHILNTTKYFCLPTTCSVGRLHNILCSLKSGVYAMGKTACLTSRMR